MPACEFGPLFVFSPCPLSARRCRSAFTRPACPHVAGWAWLPPRANKPDVPPPGAGRAGDIPLLPLSPAPRLPLESFWQPGSSCRPSRVPPTPGSVTLFFPLWCPLLLQRGVQRGRGWPVSPGVVPVATVRAGRGRCTTAGAIASPRLPGAWEKPGVLRGCSLPRPGLPWDGPARFGLC